MDNDHYMLREAHEVAEALDRGNIGCAEQRLRSDLYSMQDPYDQHRFLSMVNQMDHKGYGADLQIQRGPDGREFWNIVPSEYQQQYRGGCQQPYQGGYERPCPERNYPYQQYQPPYQQNPYYDRPLPQQEVIIQNRRDPGEAIVEGLAIGIGVAVIGQALRGGNRGYYEHNEHRNYYENRRRY